MPADAAERLTVNAAIKKLIARGDESGDAARTVIAYGCKLKSSNRIQVEVSRQQKSSGDAVSGHTAEQGQVTIEDSDPEEDRKREEWEYGTQKDRVGYYRLWKECEGLLKFHHFWKSSATTRGAADADPDYYHLAYDSKTLEPIYFGVQREKILWSFWLGKRFTLCRIYLDFIHGFAEETGKHYTLKIS